MPAPNPRRLAPGRVCQLLNSFPQTGTVLTPSRLRQIRHEAGAAICGSDPETGMPDFQSVHLLKLTAYLCIRRHMGLKIYNAVEKHAAAFGEAFDAFVQKEYESISRIIDEAIKL